VSKNLTKKAAEMLLKGATLSSQPCPYCLGVRVIKEGYALCISCGREPEKKEIPKETKIHLNSEAKEILEKKIIEMTRELELEKNHEKQQEILKTINSLIETMSKLENKQ
jgi:UPF0148 protein